MISKTYIITAAEGIHARPATALIRLVKQYKSDVTLHKGDKSIRLNSMLNILTFGAKGGDTITVMIAGEDEVDASQAIDNFFREELKKL
jgi:phosphocarrier protein HPr